MLCVTTMFNPGVFHGRAALAFYIWLRGDRRTYRRAKQGFRTPVNMHRSMSKPLPDCRTAESKFGAMTTNSVEVTHAPLWRSSKCRRGHSHSHAEPLSGGALGK